MHVFLFEILVVIFAILLAKKDKVDDNKLYYKGSWWKRQDTNSFKGVQRFNPFRDGSHFLRTVNVFLCLWVMPYLAYHFLDNTNFIPLGILTMILFTIPFYVFYHKILKPKGK